MRNSESQPTGDTRKVGFVTTDSSDGSTGFASLMEWRQDITDAGDFVDAMKSDVFEDRVFVFTPQGDVIDLPVNSTPIDFAYHIHTENGHRCRGARVGGKLVSLDTKLNTGDSIEILTTKRGGPSRDWLNPSLEMVQEPEGSHEDSAVVSEAGSGAEYFTRAAAGRSRSPQAWDQRI